MQSADRGPFSPFSESGTGHYFLRSKCPDSHAGTEADPYLQRLKCAVVFAFSEISLNLDWALIFSAYVVGPGNDNSQSPEDFQMISADNEPEAKKLSQIATDKL